MTADPSSRVRLETLGRLGGDELRAVALLVEAATEADGVRPLSEHVMLHLRQGGDEQVRNVLLYGPDGRLAGYAHVDVTDPVAGSSAEVVVHPAQRRRGYGRMLVAAVRAETPDGRLRLWAHGDRGAATALAAALGFTRTRRLWQMRRSLFAEVPPAVLPTGIRIRTFRPGEDDQAWVTLNARAFAGHPDQADWTLEDLHLRMAEGWFDPAGFFLAERTDTGELVGFHWTKVHGGTDDHDGIGVPHAHEGHGHESMGEVYVVGVDPSAQGQGLGRALTLVGLHHLRHLGLPQAMLYVDAENTAAIELYNALGFTRWDSDVLFYGDAYAG